MFGSIMGILSKVKDLKDLADTAQGVKKDVFDPAVAKGKLKLEEPKWYESIKGGGNATPLPDEQVNDYRSFMLNDVPELTTTPQQRPVNGIDEEYLKAYIQQLMKEGI